jgi:hypothetical protein
MAVNNVIACGIAIIGSGLRTMIFSLVISISRLIALLMLVLFVTMLLLLIFLASGIIHTGR